MMTKQTSTQDTGIKVRPGAQQQPAHARTGSAGSAGPGTPSPAQVEAARALLLTHRLDVQAGGCAGCGQACPCATANDAAAVVVAGGAWNTLPVERPGVPWATTSASTGPGAGGGYGRALARALTLFRRSRTRRNGPSTQDAR